VTAGRVYDHDAELELELRARRRRVAERTAAGVLEVLAALAGVAAFLALCRHELEWSAAFAAAAGVSFASLEELDRS